MLWETPSGTGPLAPRGHHHRGWARLEPFKVGDVILDRYEVTAVLGKGGMGVVLAAHRRELDDLVALKFLHPSLRDKPEIAARFAQEARTAIRIKNEHVARVFDVGSVDGVPFIVMEHLTGHDLSAILRERGQLPIAESADLLLQACEAISEAHALGIVHRDLKPGNLFVTTEHDGTPFVKVLDFGISKSTATSDMSVTASAAIVGSPQYMSPEQLLSAKSVDARSDVWALGVILYEMLTGAPPFTGEAFAAVSSAILRGEYRRPSEPRPDIPPALEKMLFEALARDREARLPSVEAFAARLAPFGTDAARVSYGRVRRFASRTAAPSERPMAPADSKAPLASAAEGGRTGHVTVTTDAFVASSIARTEPRPRRWRRMTALGALAAAAGLAVAVPRLRQARVTSSDSAGSASVDPTRTDAASVPECASGATAECEAACERGSPAACNRLAVLYAKGDGVTADAAKAVAFYTRACEEGYATACVNLGAMHFEGNGVPKNESLGARFFLRGCEAGAPVGCLNVSVAYSEGRGVPKDPAQAYSFADRACAAGVPAGCVRTALARVAGEGVAKDVKTGLAQLDGLCAGREPLACQTLAKLYATGMGTDVTADPLRVREYSKKACDLGAKQSCQVDQLLGQVDNGDNTAAQANALFQKRCDAGDAVACGMLGENLLAGIGTSVDRDKGTALLRKACAGGFDRACKKLQEGGTQ